MRIRTLLAPAASAALLLFVPVGAEARSDDAAERWKAWRDDLEYLYEEIEKPPTLRQILDDKGIEWKKVKKETDARFVDLSRAAKKRKGDDASADEVAFYDLLRFVVGQLRDSHASVRVDGSIHDAWTAAQPPRLDAGIELQLGTHDTILVSNTFAARGADSPLYGKGVRHEATILESIDGVSAAEYFAERAREKYEDEGWQSTLGRALVEALNDLGMPEDGSLKLVFKTLDPSERTIERYLELAPDKRARAFERLDWKSRKVSLRANECTKTRNPRNFRFMALELPELQGTSDPAIGWAKLASGTGYVRYGAVSGKSEGGLREACVALADCSGLILDMRLNGGGGERGVQVFDAKDGAWSKPVAVLIGPKAMSAAETELWTLREMREEGRCDARMFGRTTAGASGAKVQFQLPSGFAQGRFVCRHWHGGRSTIEGNGIEPDEVVDQDLVELSLGVDSAIRAAEEWLAER